MTDARPIVFGPGDKLAQLEAVAMHPETTDLDCRVSVCVSSRIDKYSGDAVVGQAWIAGAIGCGERSVRGSASRMEALGLWRITSGGGRGLANKWTPTAPKRGSQKPGLDVIPGTREPGICGETRQMTTRNPANCDTKPGTQQPPLPKYSPKDLPKRRGGGDGEVIGEHPEGDLRVILSALGDLLPSEDVLGAWFKDIDIGPVGDGELVLVTPSAFKATYITTHFGSHLLAAARRWRATIDNVRVVSVSAVRAAK